MPHTALCPVVSTPLPLPVCTYPADPNAVSFSHNHPSCTKVCSNGSTLPATQMCPAPVTQVCTYTSLADPYVTSYNHNYPSCTKTCVGGQTIAGNLLCPTPVTPVPTQTCWNGTVIPTTQTCPQQYRTCANGTTVPISQTCYQTCANGTTVPEGQTCYVTCPNGTTVPQYQSCPVVASLPWVDIQANPGTFISGGQTQLTWTSQNATNCTASNGWSGYKNLSGSETRYNLTQTTTFTITCYNAVGQTATDSVTVQPQAQVVKFNNVVTSPVTEITSSSARCNGIGLIAQGAPSNGWFEYGETSNLGRTTASASIGSSASAPFSNALVNLKENTSYYCRAVMNNQYGTVKGEIVKFTTKSKTTQPVYVKPTTPTKKPVQTPKNEVICSDGTVLRISSGDTASLLSQGQKLVTLNLEKTFGNLSPNQEVTYRLSYKNVSSAQLTGIVARVTVPNEVTFIGTNSGSYDSNTRTITVSNVTLAPYGEGSITFTARVNQASTIGASVVTTGYLLYSITSDTGASAQDEVTTYYVGTITPEVASTNNDTGSKKVFGFGGGQSFLPDSLIEWLALLAIIFIIAILGRSMYIAYKGEEKHSHH